MVMTHLYVSVCLLCVFVCNAIFNNIEDSLLHMCVSHVRPCACSVRECMYLVCVLCHQYLFPVPKCTISTLYRSFPDVFLKPALLHQHFKVSTLIQQWKTVYR
jgi:hypothetical protein